MPGGRESEPKEAKEPEKGGQGKGSEGRPVNGGPRLSATQARLPKRSGSQGRGGKGGP